MNEPAGPPLESDALHEELTAYLDGELDAESVRKVEERLAEDENYRRLLQQEQRTWDALDGLPRAEVEPSFSRTTVEMVAVAAAKEVDRRQAALRRWRRFEWAVVSVCTLIAAAAGYFIVSAAVSWTEPPLASTDRTDPGTDAADPDNQLDVRQEKFVVWLDSLGADQREQILALPAEEQRRRFGFVEWLDTMSKDDKGELLDLLADERLDRWREQQAEQERRRWLASLPPEERDAVEKLSPGEQTKQLAKVKSRRRANAFVQIAHADLPPEDVDALFAWLNGYWRRHRDEALERLSDLDRQRIDGEKDAGRQARIALFTFLRRHRSLPAPNDDDIAQLKGMLSPAGVELFIADGEPCKTKDRLHGWARAVLFAHMQQGFFGGPRPHGRRGGGERDGSRGRRPPGPRDGNGPPNGERRRGPPGPGRI